MDGLFSKKEIEHITDKSFSKEYVELLSRITPTVDENFEIRNDDVFLIGNAKSGTTWLQELVWLIGNDLNFKGAEVFIDERFPVLEMSTFLRKTEKYHIIVPKYYTDPLNYARGLKSPRFLKTHVGPGFLPNQLLRGEKKAKIIYISRNMKDVCLSSYHYTKDIIKMQDSTIDDYAKVFMYYSSHCWNSILYFWNRRNDRNVLFVRYEEMKSNLGDVIGRISTFLNKTLTEKQVKKLMQWLHFDQVKANNAVNHSNIYGNSKFIRKGEVGGYKTEMSPETISLFNTWTKSNLKDSDYVECEV